MDCLAPRHHNLIGEKLTPCGSVIIPLPLQLRSPRHRRILRYALHTFLNRIDDLFRRLIVNSPTQSETLPSLLSPFPSSKHEFLSFSIQTPPNPRAKRNNIIRLSNETGPHSSMGLRNPRQNRKGSLVRYSLQTKQQRRNTTGHESDYRYTDPAQGAPPPSFSHKVQSSIVWRQTYIQ